MDRLDHLFDDDPDGLPPDVFDDIDGDDDAPHMLGCLLFVVLLGFAALSALVHA